MDHTSISYTMVACIHSSLLATDKKSNFILSYIRLPREISKIGVGLYDISYN